MAGYEEDTDTKPHSGLGGAERGPDFTYDRDNLNALEQNPSSPSEDQGPEQNMFNFTQEADKSTKRSRRGRLSRGGIGALLGGGGIVALLALALPNVAIGQFDSVLQKVLGGSSTVQNTRAQQWFHNKIFGGTGQATSCSTITYLCRITTMGDEEVKTLKENGYELVANKKGEALKPDKNGRYSKAYAVREIGSPNNVYTAKQLQGELAKNADLDKAFSAIYPSKIAILRDTIAQKIFGGKNLTRNPKTTAGDEDTSTEEGRAKNAAKNFSDEQAQAGVTSGLDAETKAAVDETVASEQTDITDGTPKTGPSNIVEVSELTEPKISATIATEAAKQEVKRLAMGITLEVADVGCTNYMRGKTLVKMARFAGTAAAIAYGVHLFTVFEKVMAGDAENAEETNNLTNDVSAIMTSLNKQDSNGNSASDSAGYSAYVYNQVSPNPITSPITGGALLTAVIGLVMFFKNTPGVDDFCNAFTSPTGQGLAVAVGLIAQVGVGILSGSLSVIGSNIARLGVKEGLKIAIKELVKEDIKLAMKTVGKSIARAAASTAGWMLVSYLIDTWFVPYVAKLAAGTITSPDANGMAAIDTAILGLGALNTQNGLAHGQTTLSKDEYLKFSQYVDTKEREYIAMQRSISNPFDISDPYSVSGSIALQAASSLSKFDIISDPSKIASLPMAVLQMFSGSSVGTSTAYAATADERRELLEQCQDADMISNSDIALDIFCNAFVGFNDLNMLENTSTLDVFNYMESHNQVDENNQPILGSDYESFRHTCIDEIENKSLSTLVDEQIPPQCVDPAYNAREDIKYFRLSTIDASIDQGFQAPTATSTGSCPTVDGVASLVVSGITKGWDKRSHAETALTLCSIPETTMGQIELWKDARYEGTSSKGVTTLAINSDAAVALLRAAKNAKQEGVTLGASIGYRSLYEQCSIYIQIHPRPSECPSWVQSINDSGWSTTTVYSNHMMGYSLDLNAASEAWMRKCMQSKSTTEYDASADNRCYGFWDDVNQKEGWDSAHFTYDPVGG